MQYGLYLLFLCLQLAGATARADIAWQSVDSIRLAIESRVAQELEKQATVYRMEPLRLDGRLRLPACESPLEAFILSGQKGSGYFSVGVRCAGVKPWTIYHKVHVNIYQPVVLLKNEVRQGAVIRESDVFLDNRDLTALRGGYFGDTSLVTGQVARRTLPGGLILNPDHLLIPPPVARGQQVSIRFGSSGFQIAMPGIALSDGRMGQRIRVRNAESGKIVEGTVTAPGVVSVD